MEKVPTVDRSKRAAAGESVVAVRLGSNTPELAEESCV